MSERAKGIGWGFSYWDDESPDAGGYMVCDTEEEAQIAASRCVAMGWEVGAIRETEWEASSPGQEVA